MNKPFSVDAYIASFPEDSQKMLAQLRLTIKEVAPQADETISYGMPAFKWNGILVWFGAHTNHVGFYPRASAIEKFKKELSGYKGAKGSVQFPLREPLPLDLIKRIIQFRIEENLQKTTSKK
jgi:uncharacterized protein YdhG (YjbR/CyaY superfamily)